MKLFNSFRPPPMPQIRSALRLMNDAHDATHRGIDAWNDDQMRDAIVSARRFLELAGKAMLPEQKR